MKTAIVYDRVNKWGGAERVLLTIHEMFPDAPLYTSVYNPKNAPWAKVFPKVHTSFLQKIPGAKSRHEMFAPLMPLAFESFDFSEYDLVISVTSEAAKGIITVPGTKHICYLLTPTRYLWSGYNEYFKGSTLKTIVAPMIKYLRNWDLVAANRPDKIISISTEVQRRVKKHYGRESEIVFPPVDTNKFQITNLKFQTDSKLQISNFKKGDYYLLVSRLVKYKKVDLAIEAFNELGITLVIVGTGKEEKRLKLKAKENIIFAGRLTDEELVNYYMNARALIFPQVEDFGLVAVEAQGCGTPVIAFGKAGALDTVVDPSASSGPATGVFFENQTRSGIIKAVGKFEKVKFDKVSIIKNAERFATERFMKEFRKVIENA